MSLIVILCISSEIVISLIGPAGIINQYHLISEKLGEVIMLLSAPISMP